MTVSSSDVCYVVHTTKPPTFGFCSDKILKKKGFFRFLILTEKSEKYVNKLITSKKIWSML